MKDYKDILELENAISKYNTNGCPRFFKESIGTTEKDIYNYESEIRNGNIFVFAASSIINKIHIKPGGVMVLSLFFTALLTAVPPGVRADDAEAYFDRGFAACDEADYDGAIADYDEAIRLNPHYDLAYRNRGDAWYYKQDYARAREDWEKALQLNPAGARVDFETPQGMGQ
jgi:tetratricopeptide (TPR) repeat protein